WKRLNGTWEPVSIVMDGKGKPLPKEGATLTIEDGEYTIRRGGKVVGQGAVTLDPTTTPKSLDIRPATGGYKGKTLLAIYEVTGDTQRACVAPPGKPRP